MGSRFFCFILCFIFIFSLPCFTAAGTAADGDLVRVSSGTTLYNDADLTKAIGVLPAEAYVYAREALTSSAGEVIEIVYLKDFIIRYAYIPLMSATPLTLSEKAAYASDSADGILIRPGISLINIELAPLPSAAGSSTLTDPSPVPDHAEATAPPPVVPIPTPEPVPTLVPESVLEPFNEAFADDFIQTAGSMAKLPFGTPLYSNPELSDIMGWLNEDAYVYVNAILTVSGQSVIEIVFCRDYIIRHAYVSPSAAVPQEDAGNENALLEDGITFKPGVILSNASLADKPPVSFEPSETSAFEPFSVSDAPSETAVPPVATPEVSDDGSQTVIPENAPDNTPLPPILPTAEPSAPSEGAQPAADDGDPEKAVPEPLSADTSVLSQYADVRLKAMPTGRHYLINADDPIPAGRTIRSVTLYPMSTGYAEGTISVLYLSDGKYQVVFSKDFSLTVPYSSPWETVIPMDVFCENDAFVTVCFNSSCAARYGMAADESRSLQYFSDIDDDPLLLTVEGYAINFSIRYE